MKKFLSLVLALVMTMSLVTVSAGAKDFKDDGKVTYDEAVAVMSEVKVLDGYADGSFNPQGELTRGAAAKIICNLMLGPTTAAELHADTAPFKDVPVNHTFAGYIAYCAKEGIISGYADGAFRPAAPLTGYAFMKMLLGALGYDAEIEQYTGANWSINVAKRALNIGLNDSLEGEFNGIKHVTREEAALYAFNTLQADLVEYDSRTSVNVGGAEVVIAGSEAKAQKWNNSATKIENIKKDNYIQFAEQYFTKLVLDSDVDVFGRPSRTWEYKGEEIGTYVNTDLMEKEFTVEVSGKDLYDVLGKNVIDDYDVYVYIDGEDDDNVNSNLFDVESISKNNKQKVGATGNGVLTQVFVDPDEKVATIAIINSYLAIADGDYNDKREEASFDVHNLGKKNNNLIKTDKTHVSLKAEYDDFAIVEDVVDEAAYLVTVADGEIQTIAAAEVIEDTEITAFKKNSSVTVGGDKYSYADTADYDVETLDNYTSTANGTNLKDTTYNVYLDAYGYAIGVKEVEAADNYVFITGIDAKTSSLGNKTYEAAAIFLDGTMKVIDVNMSKSVLDISRNTALINSWCTYTVNKDDVYTVTEVKDATGNAANVPGGSNNAKGKVAQAKEWDATNDGVYDIQIDKKHTSLSGGPSSGEFKRVYGNDNSIYLTVELTEINKDSATKIGIGIIDDVASVTTGIKNANLKVWDNVQASTEADDENGLSKPIYHAYGVYTLYKDNGYVIATIVVGDDDAASKNLVYTHTGSVEQESYDKTTDEWTWTRKVVMNGEEVELKEVSDSSTYLEGMNQDTWYQVKLNAEGEVIGVTLASQALDSNKDGDVDATDEYVNDSSMVETSVNENDTVLYREGVLNSKPTMKGSVLFAKTSEKTGFFVDENVNVVLRQLNKKKMETTFETGSKALEDIIDDLNQKYDDKNFNYVISAVLEDGAATTVVIYDDADPYKPVNPSTPSGIIEVDVKSDPSDVQVYYYGATAPDEDQAVAAIEEELAEVGKIVDRNINGYGEYEFSVELKNGFTRTYTYQLNPTRVYKVTLTTADAKVTVSPKEVFLGGDLTATVEVYNGYADWGTVRTWTGSGLTISGAAGTGREQTITVADDGHLSSDVTVSLSWT